MKWSPYKLRPSVTTSLLLKELIYLIVMRHTMLDMTRRYTHALGFDDVCKAKLQLVYIVQKSRVTSIWPFIYETFSIEGYPVNCDIFTLSDNI